VGKTITEPAKTQNRIYIYGQTSDGVVFRLVAKEFRSLEEGGVVQTNRRFVPQINPDDIENIVQLFSVICF
jgi:hypothetical protein